MKVFVTIDVEPAPGKKDYSGIKKGLARLIGILKKNKLKAIFFVTSDYLEKYAGMFRNLRKKGYEIALHGFEHERWDILSKTEKKAILERAIKTYKKILGKRPKGFRAPQFSADFELLELLEKKGFVYDSSIVQCPISQAIFFPSRLFLYLKQCKFQEKIKRKKMKIKEIPVSSFILPISMFSLKILPLFIFIFLSRLSLVFKKHKQLVILAHSYELNDRNFKKLEKFLS